MIKPMADVHVSDRDLSELRSRLTATRWPDPWPEVSWEAGTELAELRRLTKVWATEFDWRSQEEAINRLPSFTTEIDGTSVHFLLFEAEREDALPLLLTHGWPSSFLELVGLARRLSRPSASGGQPDDSFTVVVPSLPGFGFSTQRPSLDGLPTYEILHRLLHDELGFERYGAHGGDLGSGISAYLGQNHPESVVGIHVLAVHPPAAYEDDTLTDEEREHVELVADWNAREGAYMHQQRTRPMSLSFGLSDSPAGLLGWILEKYRAWSDCGGDLATRFSDEDLLTQASLYWFTGTIGTSFRPYYEFDRSPAAPLGRVDVPTAVALFPGDLAQPPRSWAERTYNVTRYTKFPRGGHFAAHEEPELLAADITEFFRTLN